MPVIRHLFLHYPHDRIVQALVYQQFLVGSEILVVPVLDKGHTQVQVYFPAGDSTTWEHVWTGLLYRATDKQGVTVQAQAPLGFPAIFVKQGSWIGAQFMHNLIKEGILRVTQTSVPTKLAW
jgi:alpha-glucosidase (family GH31 glycosyl hydrolase)